MGRQEWDTVEKQKRRRSLPLFRRTRTAGTLDETLETVSEIPSALPHVGSDPTMAEYVNDRKPRLPQFSTLFTPAHHDRQPPEVGSSSFCFCLGKNAAKECFACNAPTLRTATYRVMSK
jgi:hypothetical protein